MEVNQPEKKNHRSHVKRALIFPIGQFGELLHNCPASRLSFRNFHPMASITLAGGNVFYNPGAQRLDRTLRKFWPRAPGREARLDRRENSAYTTHIHERAKNTENFKRGSTAARTFAYVHNLNIVLLSTSYRSNLRRFFNKKNRN